MTFLDIFCMELYCCISQLVRALWLVNSAGRILPHDPQNLKVFFPARSITPQKYPTNLVFSVRTVSYGPRFFPLIYGI